MNVTVESAPKITIKKAKEIAKEKLGRLPHMGCEIPVDTGTVQGSDGLHEYVTYLQNTSGKFSTWTWVSVNTK